MNQTFLEMTSILPIKLISILCLIIIINASFFIHCQTINDDDEEEEKHQIIVFAIDGLLSRKTTGRFMPLLHDFIIKGASTIQMRTVFSQHHQVVGWIPHFYGISATDFGCSDLVGCNVIPSIVPDPKSFVDILQEEFNYQINLLSERPNLLKAVLGEDYPIGYFSSRDESFWQHMFFPNTNDDRLLLFHWSILNRIGQTDGYGSTNYDAMVKCLDQQIYRIAFDFWQHSPTKTTFLLMSNHGGKGFDHTELTLDAVQVPFIMWGYGVKEHLSLASVTTETIQIPATLFDVVYHNETESVIPPYWNDEPIEQIHNLDANVVYGDIEEKEFTNLECNLPNSVSHHAMKAALMFLITFFLLMGVWLSSIVFFLFRSLKP